MNPISAYSPGYSYAASTEANAYSSIGLVINYQDQNTGVVVSSRCLFGEKHGREEADSFTGIKRKHTVTVKSFTVPFWDNNIKAHLDGQHPEK